MSTEKKAKKDKFKFVKYEDLDKPLVEDNASEQTDDSSVIIEKEPKIDSNDTKKEVVLEEKVEANGLEEKNDIDVSYQDEETIVLDEPIKEEPVKKINSFHKIHFSFEARIITMITCIVLLFLVACYLFLNALNYYKMEKVSYDEYSNVHYKVCLLENDYYENSCLEEGMEYVASLTDFVNANFEYNVDFSQDIKYPLYYHIVAVTKIFDKDNIDKVLYKNEEVLVEKTEILKKDHNMFLNNVIKIDYARYNDNVLDYQTRYSLNSSSNVEIILYLDEENETRKVASVVLPLGETTYSIKRNVITNLNRVIEIKEDTWNDFNTFCAVIASILILICIILIYRTTRLVLMVTNSKSSYEQKLSQILRDYDRLIVIARNGYVSADEKQIVKVESFEELLDAREALQKPIIYYKVNDVKSEFMVEDDDKLYKFVLKEADL